MNIKTVLRRSPLPAYFTLAFAISWGGCFAAGGPFVLRGETIPLANGILMFAAMLAGPSLAGIFMTAVVEGTPGVKALFGRMGRWRVHRRWYAPLLIFPTLILILLLILQAWVSREFKPIFFSTGLVLGLLAGFIEEIGWTGFATPHLLKKNSAVVVGLFLGVMHALYHLAADFLGNSGTFGGYWVYNFLGFSAFVIALRILIVWVYANTESLFLAQLMHASSTGFLAVLVSTEIAPVNWVVFYISYAIVLGLVAVVVLLGYGTNLVRGKQVRINEAAA